MSWSLDKTSSSTPWTPSGADSSDSLPSAAFIVGIFVTFRPRQSSALIGSLYAVGLAPFIVLMIGLGLYGLFAVRLRGERVLAWRLRMDRVSPRMRELYIPADLEAMPHRERDWLTSEIARFQADEWPGLPRFVQLLLTRRRVLEFMSGLLAFEVAWLLTVALVAPFID
jgi:hypothetical protein